MDAAVSTPGLGLWASCPDYDLEHEWVESSPPSGEQGEWRTCLRCADTEPETMTAFSDLPWIHRWCLGNAEASIEIGLRGGYGCPPKDCGIIAVKWLTKALTEPST